MSEKTRWCDFGGSYCDFPFPAYINSCPHDNNKQCPWPECQVPKQPQVSERTRALADAKAAVDIYALECGMQDYDRAGVIAAIEKLEVKP